ncbi:hypothetical protein C8N46_107235 [Kordia periserrulae]|uniref:Uncharacterized protein n=1 Tax=Kordia periserrulae TaxID=701523 RepID=A0A2T6BVW7_9FLAO|nr:hypothetical protein [Kordia periserrulae]PTX60228.1 hypothetical protein C8N46_107235 [Kordia periserrulae]
MTTNNTEIVQIPSELFTTWELSMLIIGIGCLGILIFLSIVIYNYVHRFDWDDELHR